MDKFSGSRTWQVSWGRSTARFLQTHQKGHDIYSDLIWLYLVVCEKLFPWQVWCSSAKYPKIYFCAPSNLQNNANKQKTLKLSLKMKMALSKTLLSPWYLPHVLDNLMTCPKIICILLHVVSDFSSLGPLTAHSLMYSITHGPFCFPREHRTWLCFKIASYVSFPLNPWKPKPEDDMNI